MTTQYFRITAYHPEEDLSAIFDSNGMFEKLWQFSSFLLQKGFKIIEVSSDEKFLDVNIYKAEINTEEFYLRAHMHGKPANVEFELNGIVYQAIKVGEKLYIPDKSKIRE